LLKLYYVAFFSAILTALAATPLSIVIARKAGALDPLHPRKIHLKETPRWGGIGILAGFLAGLLVLWFSYPPFKKLLHFSQGIARDGKVIFTLNLGEQLAGILFGACLLFGLGLWDDKKPVRPAIKFLIQIIAAYVAMTYGVRIYGLSIPGYEAYSQFPLWFMQIATLLWLVGMTNAVNLVDGLDGLAAGLVAIVAASFLSIALLHPKSLTPPFSHQIKLAGIIAAALLGASLGFLVYNFHPAKVFMGDSGSLSTGFILGCIAVTGAFKTTALAVLFVPFLLVAVPAFDMAAAFLRRIVRKQSPFEADRSHFHHYLLRKGWTQREAVLLVYVATLVLSLASFVIVTMKIKG
jgi:UDP-GlcNAc:undecaprenyl-phosphate/decaprenyl-phosphate GlcNAc-1-phosphate transferase